MSLYFLLSYFSNKNNYFSSNQYFMSTKMVIIAIMYSQPHYYEIVLNLRRIVLMTGWLYMIPYISQYNSTLQSEMILYRTLAFPCYTAFQCWRPSKPLMRLVWSAVSFSQNQLLVALLPTVDKWAAGCGMLIGGLGRI